MCLSNISGDLEMYNLAHCPLRLQNLISKPLSISLTIPKILDWRMTFPLVKFRISLAVSRGISGKSNTERHGPHTRIPCHILRQILKREI